MSDERSQLISSQTAPGPRMRNILLALVFLLAIMGAYVWFFGVPGIVAFEVQKEDKTIEYNGHYLNVKIHYPISSRDSINTVIDSAVQNWMGEYKATEDPEMPYSVDFPYSNDFGIDYEAYETSRTVSYVFSEYSYTGGTHGNLNYISFVFDKKTGKRLYLEDIFQGEFISVIQKHARPAIIQKLSQQNESGTELEPSLQRWVEEGTQIADGFSVFYLIPDGIGFTFAPYKVASYANGPITIELPLALFQDVVGRKW